MGDVFLSYKSEDRLRAKRLVRALETSGITVWWDQNLGVGEAWRHELGERLDKASCVIVLWSRMSVGPAGGFVQDEAARAARHGTYLPVLMEPVEMPLGFGSVQALSLVGWQGNAAAPAFQALLAKVRALAGSPHQAHAAPPAPGLNRRLLLAGGGLLALAGGTWVIAPRLRSALNVGTAPESDPVTLAVLPFDALSTDDSADFLAVGLAEELRSALARSGVIQVAARTSSNSFAGSDLALSEIARRLGVDWILDGSVRVAGQDVRVSAALANAGTGLETWSENYDRTMDDLLDMQQSIATAVATALVGTLGPESAAATARRPTQSAPAFEAYLRGRKLLDLATSAATDAEALAQFDRAIALDPLFAGAHAARARSLQALANASQTLAEQQSRHNAALAAARRAVDLDPSLAEAQSTLGYVQMYGELNFPAARLSFERAHELAPTDADILIRYGLFHARAGSMETGISALAEATRRDPYNPRAFRAHALGLLAARQHQQSIAEMRKGLALNPALSAASATIGDNLIQLKDLPAALAAYRTEPQDFSRLTGLAIAYHLAGNRAAAGEAFAALRTSGDAVAYQQAQVLAQWGRTDDSIAMLERAATLRDAGLPLLRNDPFLDPLRNDQRFRALLTRLKFV